MTTSLLVRDRPAGKLYLSDVTKMTLFFHTCRACGELVIEGFYGQLENRVVDSAGKRAWADCPCHKCGAVYRRRFRLTTSPHQRPRLVDWIALGWLAARWLPHAWFRRLARRFLWLECNVKI